ncbi:MAG: DUF4382 domain-containing protein [Acidobacteria bacterium]|nr:DUF4382 domain-containing protein [Acidobacteriota bacterium]
MTKSFTIRENLLAAALLSLCLPFIGCGLTSTTPANAAAAANTPTKGQVSMFVKDAPVDGVVAFNVSITNAALVDSAGTPYALSAWSREFEFRQLRLASALAASSVSISPATYNNLEIGLSSPRLTVVGANGVVQQLTQTSTPSVTLANSTLRTPIAFTLAAGQSQGVMLDFDLQKSLSKDANGNYVITPVLSSATTTLSGIPELSMTLVQISAIQSSAGTMDVQLATTGDTVHVKVDGTTVFDPAVAQFSSLSVGENIELEGKLQSDGSYLATNVNQGAPDRTLRFQGVLMDTNQSSANPLLELVVR